MTLHQGEGKFRGVLIDVACIKVTGGILPQESILHYAILKLASGGF